MRDKIKKFFQFFLNPRLLLCVGIAWMITNGWSYIFVGIGAIYNIPWMTAVGGAYLTFLWLPVSPEKIATFAIAIALLRWLFPNDERTLAVLRRLYQRTKNAVKRHKEKEIKQRKHNNNRED